MGKLKIGQVVSIAFPFSDLTIKKLRPALIVAIGDFGDIILCQITSKTYSSSNPILLAPKDFHSGSLPVKSYARPDKLFTADPSVVSQIYGTLETAKLVAVLAAIRLIFTPL
ncbi:MAG: type II toxin-antitoxin system PemK/MazF family toxin [Candidatus Saccharimonadales bacterium]